MGDETKVRQKIFDEVAEFDYSDFVDLESNKSYDRFFAGNLKLPTGQIVCTDPLYRELGHPQSWTVKPGEYPVHLYIGLNGKFAGRVAYAELSFNNRIADRWEFSLISEQLLVDDFEKKMNGMYPVENGLSSLSDYDTWTMYNQEIEEFYERNQSGNYYNDILEKHFKENQNIPKSSRGEDWVNYQPTKSSGNIIMFGSGWGDGLYPRYVGYDNNGQVTKLITDFLRPTDKLDIEK